MQPTIKGIFFNSHISIVRKRKGDKGVAELEKLFGKPLRVKNLDDIPVSEEVRLLECALDVLNDAPVPPEQRSLEAGHLHFQNFITTAFAKILLPFLKKKFKGTLLRSQFIARHVFKGLEFSTEDIGPTKVKIVMKNADYPIDHFNGFFEEWTSYAGKSGVVTSQQLLPGEFEYIVSWQK
jgi:uncharacterized protein (TIGR02265 family)